MIEDIQPEFEARVLGQILCSRFALADADDLEVHDFHMPMHRAVLAAIRELQCRGEAVDVLAVIDEMEVAMLTRGTALRPCDASAAVLACCLMPTYAARQCFLADMRFLRKVAVSRREMARAA